ncbi:hypothetical protein L3049_04295 [Labilibaculum sp. DW002]|uniref:Methionyl-tRNA formyltransferase n=1 Tax=Paralabilibaculum antarcticum TaxID=2912572 RepID=A0ABT5VP54_9BACT|nr:formyltransferase family protein [Labilibaculum sp. DW002]MDE5417221.1 hypothetical protein [Labilibaculum sp. DW002]
MKLFCIGANLESFRSLKYLVDQNCQIDTLITLPKCENENVSDYYDLHDFCVENKIKTIDTVNVNSLEIINILKNEKPDYLFTLGWSQIFKEDFLSCFSYFIVGSHPTKLPYGRGRAPIPWTILEDTKSSAVSFFKIDLGIDTGKLILQKTFDISPGIYAEELYNIVAQELSKGFYEIYQMLIQKVDLPLIEQSNGNFNHRSKRSKSDGLIEFSNSIYFVEKLVRAVSKPYPGAYCYYKDKKIIFWKVEFCANENYVGTLGQIHKKSSNGLLVQFCDGNLWLKNPTFENNESVDIKLFRVGEKLGYNIQDEIYYLRQNLKDIFK